MVLSVSTASAVSAQTRPDAPQGLAAAAAAAAAAADTPELSGDGAGRVTVGRNDSVLNGALIGAGVAVASGLFLCTRTEPWANCRDDVGPMLKIGALGAGIGIAIDALIRDRRTLYESADGSSRLLAAPIVGRRGAGLRLSLIF
jgi:hypothetical protein